MLEGSCARKWKFHFHLMELNDEEKKKKINRNPEAIKRGKFKRWGNFLVCEKKSSVKNVTAVYLYGWA